MCIRDRSIVLKTYQLVTNDIAKEHFESVLAQDDSFAELVGVFREITKNKKYQKLSLHSLEALKKITQKIAAICFKEDSEQLLHGKDLFNDVWLPVLFCFNDTIMTAEDLEVRSRALNYMFDALVAYGREFDDEFWEKICTKLLFPIFGVLSKHWEVNQFNSHDDLSAVSYTHLDVYKRQLEEAIIQTNNDPRFLDSILVFEALRSSCRTKSPFIVVKALDCLSKLFSFQALDETILVNPPDSMAANDQHQDSATANGITPPPKFKLIDAAVDTIADCFEGEGTDEKVELQVVRALASCILTEDSTSSCHGASLLKAVRQIYNIFIFSLSSTNQGIAQATLTQIVNSVFDKINVKTPHSERSASTTNVKSLTVDRSSTHTPTSEKPLTLQNLDNLNDEVEKIVDEEQNFSKLQEEINDEQDLIIKDAFLVFRAMAKISAKPLESSLDMRSHAVRSKLLRCV